MTEEKSYQSTVYLPSTTLGMRSEHATTEPSLRDLWDQDPMIQGQVRGEGSGPKFVLHDGPPYANGDIHMGHAMNKVLKDMIARGRRIQGDVAPLVPGWDCHGLPIEWKVEELYKAEGVDARTVDILEFRQRCRDYAAQWVNVQREQFKRLGILADWQNPYLTMDAHNEARTLEQLYGLMEEGLLYRGAKPVMWSPVERTSLAEAEVEYKDVTSTQVHVAFDVAVSSVPELKDARFVIWTTTPWSLGANQALAVHTNATYVCLDTTRGRLILAEARMAETLKILNLDHDYQVLWRGKGLLLRKTTVLHPMRELGGFFATARPVLTGNFVSMNSGTGVVHLAPDHGVEDFDLCANHGIHPVYAVQDSGRYREDWPWLGGASSVINNTLNSPEGFICTDLARVGALMAASQDYVHSYPHSWRSGAKVIQRATSQWFLGVLEGGNQSVKSRAQDALDGVAWYPERAQGRIRSMLGDRPDWLISRQRRWGVPMALYVNRTTGTLLKDPEVNARILGAMELGGSDVWYQDRHAEFLGARYQVSDWEPVQDILDVWFDSGTTFSFVLEDRLNVRRADLVVEGSDQHRGWFQSSLLASVALQDQAPYKAVLTHGFVLDQHGKKMSKSAGNVKDPLKIIDTHGADVLRLWVARSNYVDDVRVSDENIKGSSELYRKVRNTLRYLLGAITLEHLPIVQRTHLDHYDHYMMTRLEQLERECVEDLSQLDLNAYVGRILDFMVHDLSGVYFDVRKDLLYCGSTTSNEWWSYQTALRYLLEGLVTLLSPVVPYLTEEVWQIYREHHPNMATTVHANRLQLASERHWASTDPEKWKDVMGLRKLVLEEVEKARAAKLIKSSQEVGVRVTIPQSFVYPHRRGGWAELFLVSEVDVQPGLELKVELYYPNHHKCPRCRRYLDLEPSGLCGRCQDVVEAMEEKA